MEKSLNFKKISPKLHRYFSKKEQIRDKALQLSRITIRNCSLAIKHIHRQQKADAEKYLKKAGEDIKNIKRMLKDYPDLFYVGFVQDAKKEFVEANVIYNICYNNNPPSLEGLDIEYAPYLNGLGEAVGEMRRMILDKIRCGDMQKGLHYLNIMEEIYYFLLEFDYPDALTLGLRRTVDLVRSLLEKTRGDLIISMNHNGLKKTLEDLKRELTGKKDGERK